MARNIYLPIISKFDDKGIKQAESGFDGFKSSLGKIAGVIAGAFAVDKLVDFGKESIALAEQVKQSNDRIGAIADSMGIFGDQAGAVSQRLIDLADSQEILLGVDDSIIKSTQAKLLTFKQLAGTADEAGGAFDRATAAAIDLAAAGFGTAESNATALGKALQDPIKGIAALARSGVTFTDVEKEKIKTLVESGKTLEAQDMILKAIETQVGGTAAATATASEKMALAFENVKETVGAALLPAFQSLITSLLPVIEKLGPQIATVVTALTPVFDKFAALVPVVIDALMPLVPIFVDLITLIADLAISIMPIFLDVLNLILPIIAAILPVFTQFLKGLLEPLIPVVKNLIVAFKPFVDAIVPILQKLLEKLVPFFLKLLDAVITPLIPIVVALITAFGPLLELVLPLLVYLLETFVLPVLDFLIEVLKVILPAALAFVTASFTNFGKFMEKFGGTFKDIWNGISSFFKGVVNGILGFYEGMINGFISMLNGGIRAINGLLDGIPAELKQMFGLPNDFNINLIPKLKLPRLAEGGIVMPKPGGVIAQIAEAGQPEAVIPLDRFGDMGNKTYNITVNAGMGVDARSVGERIVNEITKFERSNGSVFARA